MFLHEAIVKVLRENISEMTFQEIADEINGRELYKKKDGTRKSANIAEYKLKAIL